MVTLYDTNIQRLFSRTAEALAKEMNFMIKKKGSVTIALPGGRSILPLYALFKSEHMFPWKHTHIFTVDERCVGNDDTENNFKLLKDNFIDTLVEEKVLPEANIHGYYGNSENHEDSTNSYASTLKKIGRYFDIVLLGVGEDGHVAALFPNHASIESADQYFITISDAPKPPPKRMSASPKLLLQSQIAFVFFIGEEKKEAYKKFLDTTIPIAECPAKIALKIPKYYVITDRGEQS